MKIAYGKIGRSYNLSFTKQSTLGGDIDVTRLLRRLAWKYPQHEFILLGRNSGERPMDLGYPSNVTNPWTVWREQLRETKLPEDLMDRSNKLEELVLPYVKEIDQVVMWLGQHGTSNSPIPKIGEKDWGGELTNPQISMVNYGSYLLRFINRWRDVNGPLANEEIWLCPDPRNYLKCRDLKWPLQYPILAQYEQTRQAKFERYGVTNTMFEWPNKFKREDTVWIADVQYAASSLELTALPDPSDIPLRNLYPSQSFGMIVNENRAYVARDRKSIIRDWVLSWDPSAWLYGTWSEESQKELGREINPVSYDQMMSTLKQFRSTLTTPASGSGWATAKPWEAFAAGVVCFFHPEYDTQGWIIPTRDDLKKGRLTDLEDLENLSYFLRVTDPRDLAEKVAALEDEELWREMIVKQRAWYEIAMEKTHGGMLSIEKRLGLLEWESGLEGEDNNGTSKSRSS